MGEFIVFADAMVSHVSMHNLKNQIGVRNNIDGEPSTISEPETRCPVSAHSGHLSLAGNMTASAEEATSPRLIPTGRSSARTAIEGTTVERLQHEVQLPLVQF